MAKARRVAAAAVVLLIVGLVVHSSITATGEPCAVQPSSDNTGIALGSGYTAMSDAEMDRTVEAIRSSGSHWVRFDIDWSAIESTEGTFDWSGTDRLVDIAQSSGLEILGLITYTPAWARAPAATSPAPHTRPADPDAFGRFAALAAARYSNSISSWEIWNEPNLQTFFNPTPDPEYYSKLLAASSVAIEAVQPGATIVSGGLSPATDNGADISPTTFLANIYEYGAGQHFDVVGTHPYTYPALPSDPLTRNWNSFYRMRLMHDTMVANGDSTKSIWATEFGAPTGTGLDAVTESMQAEILRDGFNEARSLGFVQKVFVYSLQDRGSDPGDREQNFGLLDLDFEPKPAMAVLQDANETGGCL